MGWVVLLMESASTFSSVARILKFLRFSRYLRLMRAGKVLHIINKLLETSSSIMLVLLFRMTTFLFFMGVWAHTNACVWYHVGNNIDDGWVYNRGYSDAPVGLVYAASVHWALAQMQGSTDILPGGSLQE